MHANIGSPADRKDCDEILEINGKSLGQGNTKHAEIVQHIHEVSSRRKEGRNCPSEEILI